MKLSDIITSPLLVGQYILHYGTGRQDIFPLLLTMSLVLQLTERGTLLV